jgi:uncharacterized membrane protein YGL010W
MKNTAISRINPAKRLVYALVGVLAGDVMLLFFLLQHALHGTLLAGEPARTVSDTVQTFILYAIFSFVGWLFVGLPATLLFPAGSIIRLSWPRALILGAISGPIALLVIFALLSRSHIYFRNLAEVSTLLAYTILVSTVSFMVYLALLRKHKEMKSNPTRSQNFFHQA